MYEIALTASAYDDIAWFARNERRIILDGIEAQLSYQPGVTTRNRKQLRPNLVTEWELRIGRYRVFYDIVAEDRLVEVKMVGLKERNRLHVRGQEYFL